MSLIAVFCGEHGPLIAQHATSPLSTTQRATSSRRERNVQRHNVAKTTDHLRIAQRTSDAPPPETHRERNRTDTTCYEDSCRNIVGHRFHRWVEKPVQLAALQRQDAPPTFTDSWALMGG